MLFAFFFFFFSFLGRVSCSNLTMKFLHFRMNGKKCCRLGFPRRTGSRLPWATLGNPHSLYVLVLFMERIGEEGEQQEQIAPCSFPPSP